VAGAKQLADYIRTQSPSRTVHSYDSVKGQLVPTGSPEARAAVSPVAGNNFFQNALIGSGKYFTDQALGAQQIVAPVLDAIDPQQRNLTSLITGPAPSRVASLQQEAADKRAIDAPVAATAGGKAGQIGTGVLESVLLGRIPGANSYPGAIGIGAGFGALNPTTANDSRLINTAIGGGLGAAGQAAGNLVGRWLSSRAANAQAGNDAIADEAAGLNAAQQSAADAGRNLGMRMTPGQATGSRSLQQLEAKLESQPWTSGPFNTVKANNQAVLNRSAAQAIGETGDTVDAATLAQANDRLGQVFESVRNPNSVVATNPQVTKATLDQVDNDVRGLLPGNSSIRDNPLVSDFESMTAQGGINAQQLGQLSSKLGKAAAKQMTSPNGDRDWGQALFAVKNHVDDMLQSTLSPEEAGAYAAARSQYRNLMTITSRTNIVNPSSGNVPGVALANKLQQADRRGFLFGGNQSDLYNAARFAQAFKPIVGDSGTATRLPLGSGIDDMVLGAIGNVAARAYLSRPSTALLSGVRGAGNAVGSIPGVQAALPYLQSGLPGLGGALVPYLTQ